MHSLVFREPLCDYNGTESVVGEEVRHAGIHSSLCHSQCAPRKAEIYNSPLMLTLYIYHIYQQTLLSSISLISVVYPFLFLSITTLTQTLAIFPFLELLPQPSF